jgi:hypothetical protein
VSITSVPLYSTILAMAATFLALSLLVQVIQELYKYMTGSRSRAYRNALIDFLGPHAEQLFRPGAIPDLQVRGPFQLLRRRPTGHLEPMDKDDLLVALERTAAPWIQRAITALRLEVSIQKGKSAPPSPSFEMLLNQVGGTIPGSPGHATALDVKQFLDSWKAAPNIAFDASAVYQALRQRFLPNVVRAEESFTQLTKNFDHTYRRRNLRQTMIFGFLLAFLAEQPLPEIYRAAKKVPLEQAVAAAEEARAIYQQEGARDTSLMRTPEELAKVGGQLTNLLARPDSLSRAPWEDVTFERLGMHALTPRYLFGCLLTALLIAFGAPLWNDLTGAILRLYKGPTPQRPRETDT